jgi:hypothetical protein
VGFVELRNRNGKLLFTQELGEAGYGDEKPWPVDFGGNVIAMAAGSRIRLLSYDGNSVGYVVFDEDSAYVVYDDGALEAFGKNGFTSSFVCRVNAALYPSELCADQLDARGRLARLLGVEQ